MPTPTITTGYTLTYPPISDRPPMAVRFTVAPDDKGTWTVERQAHGAAGRILGGDQPRRYYGDEAQVRAEGAYRGLVVREVLHLGQMLDLALDPRDIRFIDGVPTLDGMDAGQWLDAVGTG
ncbi:hypothetical protein OG455_39225 [Kitasatospora sp. NBC_01287]|uniref:hypothetical protein n=1 Tax=Kitasatospora sp. NBC_01287 TaxID=2903573 RepID=UPI002255C818|nr:hypothetical protein [Kitasatospora sp. NBC_01287]MCX4751469.1 hypothetical protein [Kitasatospora sp. NBC_01287]